MLSLNKKVFKKIVKNQYILKTIKTKLFCNYCGGKGYIYIEKNKYKICEHCSGVGIISYSYFL
tara:strand:- start:28121 stop:28309 length:189 start_codon:yes stop_codon:yes gene_type:complete